MKFHYYFDKTPDAFKQFKASLQEFIRDEVNAYMQGRAGDSTKVAVRQFFDRTGEKIYNRLGEILEDEFRKYNEDCWEILDKKKNIKEDLDKIKKLEAEIEELTAKRDALAERFHDVKSAEAFALYQSVSEPQRGDSEFAKQRRITAAGLMASAYLGMTSYNLNSNNVKNTPEND